MVSLAEGAAVVAYGGPAQTILAQRKPLGGPVEQHEHLELTEQILAAVLTHTNPSSPEDNLGEESLAALLTPTNLSSSEKKSWPPCRPALTL